MTPFMSRDTRYDYYERDYNCLQDSKKKVGNSVQQRSDYHQATTTEKQSSQVIKDNKLHTSPSTTYDNMFNKDQKLYRPNSQTYGRSTNTYYTTNAPYQEIGKRSTNVFAFLV